MNNISIKALKPFVVRDSETGQLTSFACGEIVLVDETLGNQLVADGLASLYQDLVPYGTKNITANGTYNVTEFASATVNVGTLTVTYDLNGGTGSIPAVTVIAGNSIEVNDGTGVTSPTTYEFRGWATTSDATEPDVTSPYTPTANTTLYAVYEQTQYTVTYDSNGGTGTIAAVTVDIGEAVSLSDGTGLTAPTEEDGFVGWATTSDATEPDVTSPYTPNADVTLYAVYAKTKYIVTYDSNGGGGQYSPSLVNIGESVYLPISPANEFRGWATEATATEPDVTSPYTPTADITLYAVWDTTGGAGGASGDHP